MYEPDCETTDLVLIVDDNVDGCRALARLVKHLGYRGICLPSGEMALAYLQTARPSLIILDVMMPDMDGYEVLKAIRTYPPTRDIAVVMFSALNEPDQIDRALRLGANDFWLKSGMDFAELRSRIEPYIGVGAP